MDKLHLDPVEERLYIACSNEHRLKKHRQKTMLVTVLYAAVFAMLTFLVPISRTFGIVIGALLVVYAFIVMLELRHISNLIFYYRSLNRKLLTRLKEKGSAPELWENRLAENKDSSYEYKLARRATAFALAYALLMAALQIVYTPYTNPVSGIVTVLFVIIAAALKISALNRIRTMKQIAYSTGKILNK